VDNRPGRRRPAGIAVVTGAAGGIGSELALLLAGPACPARRRRAITARPRKPLHAARGSLAAYPLDVRAEDQLTAVAEDLAHTHDPVPELFNVAGAMHVESLVDSSVTDLRRVIDVNLIGTRF